MIIFRHPDPQSNISICDIYSQEKQATNLAHFISKSNDINQDLELNQPGGLPLHRGTGHSQRITVNVGIGQLSQGTSAAKEEHYAADLERFKQVFIFYF